VQLVDDTVVVCRMMWWKNLEFSVRVLCFYFNISSY